MQSPEIDCGESIGRIIKYSINECWPLNDSVAACIIYNHPSVFLHLIVYMWNKILTACLCVWLAGSRLVSHIKTWGWLCTRHCFLIYAETDAARFSVTLLQTRRQLWLSAVRTYNVRLSATCGNLSLRLNNNITSAEGRQRAGPSRLCGVMQLGHEVKIMIEREERRLNVKVWGDGKRRDGEQNTEWQAQ